MAPEHDGPLVDLAEEYLRPIVRRADAADALRRDAGALETSLARRP